MNAMNFALMELQAALQLEQILGTLAKDMMNGNNPRTPPVAQLAQPNNSPVSQPNGNAVPSPSGQSGVVPPAE